MAYVILTDTSGNPRSIDPTQVRAVIPAAEDINAPIAAARVVTAIGTPSCTVVGTAAAVRTALGLTGYATLLLSQALSGPTTLGGANAFVMPGGSPQLSDVVIPGFGTPLTKIEWEDGESLVVNVLLATVATALAGLPVSAGNQIVLAGGACDALGVVLAQYAGGRAITCANAAGHVVGSGTYVHVLSGADLPAALLIMLSPLTGTAIPVVGFSTGPTNMTVQMGRNTLAGANVTAAGVLSDNIGIAFTNPHVGASGVYEYTVDTTSSFVVAVALLAAVPVGGTVVEVTMVGAGTFKVTMTTPAGVAVDQAHSVAAIPTAAGNQFTGADGGYEWLLVRAA